jgi:hypothetical protein
MPDEVMPLETEVRVHENIRGIVPRSLHEALDYAKMICEAGMCPSSYMKKDGGKETPDPVKVCLGILKGLEVGIPPLSALSNIAIINNTPCLWGDAAVALVQSSGMLERMTMEYVGQEVASPPVPAKNGNPDEADYTPLGKDFPDDFRCVVKMWRKGQAEPYEGTFTVRDAKRAHLWGNSKKAPWIEHPKRMLLWRARAYCIRNGFADMLCGLAIREEIEDMPTAPTAHPDVSFLDDAPGLTRTEQAAIEHTPSVPFEAPEQKEPAALQDSQPAATEAQVAPEPPPATPAPAPVPAPPEPKAPKSSKGDLAGYVDALIAWIPSADPKAIADHQARNVKVLDFIRVNRHPDFARYMAALDAKR